MAERETGQPDAVDGSGVPSDGAFATSFLQRAVVRRRVRFLRRRRELALHDLGGFVFESHRLGEAREELLAAKLAALGALDDELAALQRALDLREELTVLREPGIASCARCGAIHDSAANFCPSCGMPAGTAAAPQEQAAFEEPAADTPQGHTAHVEAPADTPQERAALEEPAADTPQQQSALEAPAATPLQQTAIEEPADTPQQQPAVEQPPADAPHEQTAPGQPEDTPQQQPAPEQPPADTPQERTAFEQPPADTVTAHEEAPPRTDGEAAPLEATQ